MFEDMAVCNNKLAIFYINKYSSLIVPIFCATTTSFPKIKSNTFQ